MLRGMRRGLEDREMLEEVEEVSLSNKERYKTL